MTTKILALAGSSRKDSFNKRLAKNAAAQNSGVTLIDLKDFPLPIYDGDLEAQSGIPDVAKRLRDLFVEHQGLIIASPEYNSSVTPLLKNAIDWISRPEKDVEGLIAFKGKVALLLSASVGALGGLRGLVHLRSILGNIGVLVMPEQLSISQAAEGFNPDGTLRDSKKQATLQNYVKKLASLVESLSGAK